MALRNKLKKVLEDKGISAYRVIHDLGVNPKTVYKLYRDAQILPSGKTLERICDYYDLEPNDLLEKV